MINRKQLAVSILFASIFLTIAAVPLSLQQVTYDAWADINDDGKIDIRDIAYTAQRFGTAGDPTKNVNITNPGPGILPVVTWYIYSAPFIVCNNPITTHPNEYGVGPGTYETDILVHNPTVTKNVTIKKKVVFAYPEPRTGEIYWIGSIVLPPDGAFRIDSPEIIAPIPPPPIYLYKGFVVLIANSPYLDVVAVHTVTSTTTQGLITDMETMTINPKPYI